MNKNSNSGKTASLHPRNPHRGRYDLHKLSQSTPELTKYFCKTPDGRTSLDFANPKAVLALNKALLASFYKVSSWQIPAGYLCPPIPGRADYIHHLADLLSPLNQNKAPKGKQIQGLDIGTGASCIYPIIGSQAYGWRFLCSDIDPKSIATVEHIVQANTVLKNKISARKQDNPEHFFKGIISPHQHLHFTMCNPPFHASMKEALAANTKKRTKLTNKQQAQSKDKLNFGGQQAELWCPGGEITFVRKMQKESVDFAEQVCWFTTLVSKKENLRPLQLHLRKLGVQQQVKISMRQGQKVSRILAWSFLTPEQQIARFVLESDN